MHLYLALRRRLLAGWGHQLYCDEDDRCAYGVLSATQFAGENALLSAGGQSSVLVNALRDDSCAPGGSINWAQCGTCLTWRVVPVEWGFYRGMPLFCGEMRLECDFTSDMSESESKYGDSEGESGNCGEEDGTDQADGSEMDVSFVPSVAAMPGTTVGHRGSLLMNLFPRIAGG